MPERVTDAPGASAVPKVKTRLPDQRSCNEKGANGKFCAGHLKLWSGLGEDAATKYGVEVYRCAHCHAVYLPAAQDKDRS